MIKVKVYFTSNAVFYFDADSPRNAREIAKRIITEGCFLIDQNGLEEFYPITQIYKVKVLPDNYKEKTED